MKTILVLTDFSPAARQAALYAAGLTQQLEADELLLYHSYEFIPPAEVPLPEPADMERFHQESLAALTELKDELRTFVSERTLIGVLADDRPLLGAAIAIAAERQAGLTVMGVTGKSQLEQILVGSHTLLLAQEMTGPVLLVPQEAVFEKIRRVVFACELENVSASTPVQTIRRLLHALGAHLLVLNVDTRNQANFTPDTIDEQSVLHQLWDREAPDYHYLIHEDIAAGLLQFTREHDVQLLIAVPRHHSFFDRLFHGSLTKKLAFHTSVPLLLIHH
jgi:nucleotide-binding universal stress UspA family protein